MTQDGVRVLLWEPNQTGHRLQCKVGGQLVRGPSSRARRGCHLSRGGGRASHAAWVTARSPQEEARATAIRERKKRCLK